MSTTNDLRHAHEILARRRATLAAVHDRAALATLLRTLPDELNGCQVHVLLRACPYIGDAKVREICTLAQVWPLSLMGHLYIAERDHLARLVEA